MLIFLLHLCQIPKSYYKMKSRFGTKTVALTTSNPRLAEFKTRGKTIPLLLLFFNENPSPHVNDVVTKMLTNTTVDVRSLTLAHIRSHSLASRST